VAQLLLWQCTSNQLTHVGDNAPTTPQSHVYDANGSLIREATSRHFEWDHSNQMKAFRIQAGTAEPSVHAQYLYDASGQRVKKICRKQGGAVETRVCINGLFEHCRWQSTNNGFGENNRLHIMDGQQRIALVQMGTAHPEDNGPPIQYYLGDHLG